MFPQPKARRTMGPRPINPADTALTTGLPLNPNGTYVANPYPTTAAAGNQGQYGAMLPQVQVNPLQNYHTATAPNNSVYNVTPLTPNSNNPLQNYHTATSNNPFYTPPVTVPQATITPQVNRTVAPGSFAESQQSRFNIQNAPVYSASGGHPDPGLIQRLATNPEEFNTLAPSQQEAVQRLLEQSAAGQGGEVSTPNGGGNSDFMNTGFMQYNAANNVAFNKQLRWDPDRKRYVQIGTLLKEGKLDLKGRWHKKRRSGGGGGPQQTTGGFTGSYGLVNFNTGSG